MINSCGNYSTPTQALLQCIMAIVFLFCVHRFVLTVGTSIFLIFNGWKIQLFREYFTCRIYFLILFCSVPTISPTLPNTPLNALPVPTLSPQHLPQQQQPQQPPAQQQQQQPQPEVVPNQPNRNVRMNAGPGGVGMQDDDDNENPRNRDWLDRLYTSLRAFMLLSIVYFYSSTSRFIMVTILAFLLYLYQNGWFTPRRVPIPGKHVIIVFVSSLPFVCLRFGVYATVQGSQRA